MGVPRGNAQGQTNIFRAVKHCLPGPYTFILPASKELPKQCTKYGATANASRKHVGVRMPDDTVCQAILRNLGAPLICTSVKWPAEDQWILDPVSLQIFMSQRMNDAFPFLSPAFLIAPPTKSRQEFGMRIVAMDPLEELNLETYSFMQ